MTREGPEITDEQIDQVAYEDARGIQPGYAASIVIPEFLGAADDSLWTQGYIDGRITYSGDARRYFHRRSRAFLKFCDDMIEVARTSPRPDAIPNARWLFELRYGSGTFDRAIDWRMKNPKYGQYFGHQLGGSYELPGESEWRHA